MTDNKSITVVIRSNSGQEMTEVFDWDAFDALCDEMSINPDTLDDLWETMLINCRDPADESNFDEDNGTYIEQNLFKKPECVDWDCLRAFKDLINMSEPEFNDDEED